jgi:hypothetical protein
MGSVMTLLDSPQPAHNAMVPGPAPTFTWRPDGGAPIDPWLLGPIMLRYKKNEVAGGHEL